VEIIRKQSELKDNFSATLYERGYLNGITDQEAALADYNNLNMENEEFLSFAKELKQNGYKFINDDEGQIGIGIDYNSLQAEFGKNIPEMFNVFLNIKEEPRVAIDGGITVSWEEHANRLVVLEKVNKGFGNIDSSHVYEEYSKNLSYYFKGNVNAPAFENGILIEPLKSSYEKVLTEHSDTGTYLIINEYYNLLEQGNFKEEAVTDFNLIRWEKVPFQE
jgi:hypothetical protein